MLEFEYVGCRECWRSYGEDTSGSVFENTETVKKKNSAENKSKSHLACHPRTANLPVLRWPETPPAAWNCAPITIFIRAPPSQRPPSLFFASG
ncbi:Hypothetical protein NTJ_08738 [Nesidiocoris tenuis]|uniref:Uncharacterized protein n=1 Tax=Nesidiocoris tenuis TaxID=355587 RepID=A0ABN7AWN6_9HEMI|nr:Hypothetical protein NTJ_08738 [Nesidiocoris tenuis]